ncbi:hypothetical protein O1L55_24700 [Streptomyces albulus]|nr:hypothetical protein [Streptomyces noursei]
MTTTLDGLGTHLVHVEVATADRTALADALRARAADGTRFGGVVSLLALRDTCAGAVPEAPP